MAFMLQWFLNLLIQLITRSSESSNSESHGGEDKFSLSTTVEKCSIKTSQMSESSWIKLSFSNKEILSLLLCLLESEGLTVFQNFLLSETSFGSNLLQKALLAFLLIETQIFLCILYASLFLSVLCFLNLFLNLVLFIIAFRSFLFVNGASFPRIVFFLREALLSIAFIILSIIFSKPTADLFEETIGMSCLRKYSFENLLMSR